MQVTSQVNIAESLDKEEIDSIAQKVVEDYETDLDSRNIWEEKHADWKRLYDQIDKPIQRPWDGSSEESLPMITEACNQFQARSYRTFFPGRKFIDAVPSGEPTPDLLQRAERIGEHMSYQLGVVDRQYKRDKNKMFLSVALHGSDFTKTYYDTLEEKPVVERVSYEDLVAPYSMGDVEIDALPRKTHRQYISINDSAIKHKAGQWLHQAVPMPQGSDDASNERQQVQDEMQGLEDTLNDSRYDYDKFAEILEQHCLLDLDKDGIAEPYIVWVDKTSRKLLRLEVRYYTDDEGMPVDDLGRPSKRKIPIEYFTHYQFFPNPDGFYGLGMGHLVGEINKAANMMLRQTIDAASLANVGNMSGFVSEALGTKGGELDLKIGYFKKIPKNVEDIGRSIYQMQFPGPNPSMGEMLNYLQSNAQRLTSTTEALSGETESVQQATTMLTLVEQSLQMFSSVQEFLSYSMEDELNKVYRINGAYLDEEKYYVVNKDYYTVTREDYRPDLRVTPLFDPRVSTRQQRVAQAQAEYQFALQNPLIMNDQDALYNVSKRYLEALQVNDIDSLLPNPADQQAPEPERIDNQSEENMYFLMPPSPEVPMFDVFPDQDHGNHIMIIDQMMQDPLMQQELQQNKGAMEAILTHRQKHIAYLYGQQQGLIDEPELGLDAGGLGDMAAMPGDEGALADLAGGIPADVGGLGGPADVTGEAPEIAGTEPSLANVG